MGFLLSGARHGISAGYCETRIVRRSSHQESLCNGNVVNILFRIRSEEMDGLRRTSWYKRENPFSHTGNAFIFPQFSDPRIFQQIYSLSALRHWEDILTVGSN